MSNKPVNSSNARPTRKTSLQTVFVVPILLQILVAVSLTGWLSLRNGEKAVNNVASQLLNEVTTRVDEHLESYLKIPPIINEINRDAINLNNLDLENIWDWQPHLFKQMQLFKNVSSIAFGSRQGEVVWLVRLDEGNLELAIRDDLTAGNIEKYALDPQGNIITPAFEKYEYDPRNRPWYQAVVKAGNPTWSKIYRWIGKDDSTINFGISNGLPYYDEKGIRQGVLAVDLSLDKISQFLSNLKIGKSGKIFILERSGLMVGTSTSEKLFMTQGNGEKLQRLEASESSEPLIKAAAKYLQERFLGLTKINQKSTAKF